MTFAEKSANAGANPLKGASLFVNPYLKPSRCNKAAIVAPPSPAPMTAMRVPCFTVRPFPDELNVLMVAILWVDDEHSLLAKRCQLCAQAEVGSPIRSPRWRGRAASD